MEVMVTAQSITYWAPPSSVSSLFTPWTLPPENLRTEESSCFPPDGSPLPLLLRVAVAMMFLVIASAKPMTGILSPTEDTMAPASFIQQYLCIRPCARHQGDNETLVRQSSALMEREMDTGKDIGNYSLEPCMHL